MGQFTDQASLLVDSFTGEGRESGDAAFEAVYADLRRLAAFLIARQPPGQSLQATELVNEAYLRLVGGEQVDWSNRRHFVNTVAQAMRQVLIDRARRKAAGKRGGDRPRIDLAAIDVGVADRLPVDQFADLEHAVNVLDDVNARWGEIVRMRFILGLTIAETADVMDISPALVKKDWRFARAWLANRLKGQPDG